MQSLLGLRLEYVSKVMIVLRALDMIIFALFLTRSWMSTFRGVQLKVLVVYRGVKMMTTSLVHLSPLNVQRIHSRILRAKAMLIAEVTLRLNHAHVPTWMRVPTTAAPMMYA